MAQHLSPEKPNNGARLKFNSTESRETSVAISRLCLIFYCIRE